MNAINTETDAWEKAKAPYGVQGSEEPDETEDSEIDS
jgi:hypothetical protein